MKMGEVQEIANELFDGDSTRFNELIQGVKSNFDRLEKLERLCQEMVDKPPGKVYFNPWAEKLKAFGIVKSTSEEFRTCLTHIKNE